MAPLWSALQAPHWGAEALRLRLGALLPGLSVEVLPSVASTNTVLLERARSGVDSPPCLLVAEAQTAGRGRQGRIWHSQAGASLTYSLSLPLAPADWSGLSLAVGLALADALDPPTDRTAPAAPRIGLKWPNDLWLMDAPDAPARRGRKLGGILIETVGAGARRVAVVGVGLNVAPMVLDASSLSQGQACLQELDAALTAPLALARVAPPLLQALLRFEREGFAPRVADYARRDVLRGAEVTTTDAQRPGGRAAGVDDQGALLLRNGPLQGLHRVLSGEVSVRPGPPVAIERPGGA
jgi:BirA family biotin operon repressor/biotin-[acetyl-CoA-carboxylase] ligase